MPKLKSIAQFTLRNIEKTFTFLDDVSPKKLLGVPLSVHIESHLRDRIHNLKQDSSFAPKLTIVLASDDPASLMYVRKQQEACNRVGIRSEIVKQQNNFNSIKSKLCELNNDANTHGIMLQLPIAGVDNEHLVDLIHPDKDIEGTNTLNVGFLSKGNPRFIPSTLLGVYVLLRCYGINTSSTHAVILDKSENFGNQLAFLMSRLGTSNVTILNVDMMQEDAEAIMSTAEIVIVATDTPGKFKSCGNGSIVIDVGINRMIETGSGKSKLIGDVDIEAIEPFVAGYSPVPGGIGPIKRSIVLVNTYLAYLQQVYKEDISESIGRFLNISTN